MKNKKEIGFDYKTQVWGLIGRVTALEDKGQHPIYERLIETIARVDAIEQDLKGNKSSGYIHDRLYRNDPVDWDKRVETGKPKECKQEEVKESELRKYMFQEFIMTDKESADKVINRIRQLAIEKVKEVESELLPLSNAYLPIQKFYPEIIKKLEEM